MNFRMVRYPMRKSIGTKPTGSAQKDHKIKRIIE